MMFFLEVKMSHMKHSSNLFTGNLREFLLLMVTQLMVMSLVFTWLFLRSAEVFTRFLSPVKKNANVNPTMFVKQVAHLK